MIRDYPMTEIQNTVETGKQPTPVSYKEYSLMDRHEARAFFGKLTKDEKKDFQAAVVRVYTETPLSERRAIAQELVAKLEKRENKTIGDKLELVLEKLRLKQIMLPEKPPLLLQKLRNKPMPLPRFIKEAKSPYLIR